MASNKNPRERATKKDDDNDVGKAVVGGAAAVGVGLILKTLFKKGGLAVLFAVILLGGGFAAGFFGWQYLTKNDTFTMQGEDFVTISMNESYNDLGVTAVVFGQDKTGEVTTKYYYREDISYEAKECEKVDTSVAGYYYAVYTLDGTPYHGVELIRTIEILRVEDNG